MFLSYARCDEVGASLIHGHLFENGLAVFMDTTGVPVFDGISASVLSALRRSKVLVAYYSEAYRESQACMSELREALIAGYLEGDPRKRVLVINPESGGKHVVPQILSDSRYFQVPSDSELDMAKEVRRAILGLSDICDILPLEDVQWFGSAPRQWGGFVGRENELWSLNSALFSRETELVHGIGSGAIQIRGGPGIGKTRLVEEYVRLFGRAFSGGVYWVRGGASKAEGRDPEELRCAALRKMGNVLGVGAAHGGDIDCVVSGIREFINSRSGLALWIIDDVPSGAVARDWLGPAVRCRNLITAAGIGVAGLPSMEISEFSRRESVAALSGHTGLVGSERATLESIAVALGCHPMACDIAGAIATAAGISGAGLLKSFSSPWLGFLGLAGRVKSGAGVSKRVALELAFRKLIGRLSPASRDYLRLVGVLGSDPIPHDFVIDVFAKVNAVAEAKARQSVHSAIAELGEYGVLAVDPGSRSRGVSSLLLPRFLLFEEAQFLRRKSWFSKSESYLPARIGKRHQEIERAAVYAALEFVRGVESEVEAEMACVVSHGEHLSSQPRDLVMAELCYEIGLLHMRRGAWWQSRDLLSKAGRVYQSILGGSDLRSIEVRSQLACALREIGCTWGGCAVHFDVEKEYLKLFGEDHDYTLSASGNLAVSLAMHGLARDAVKVQCRVIRIMRGQGNHDELAYLTTVGNLAHSLRDCRKLRWAKAAHLNVATRRLELLGPDHLQTIRARGALALALLELGEIDDSIELCAKVRRQEIKVLGREHPDTARSTFNLGSALWRRGDRGGAIELLQEAAAVRTSNEGFLLAEQSMTIRALVSCMLEEERCVEAAPWQELLVELCDRENSSIHELSTDWGQLASLRLLAGDLDGAYAAQCRAIALVDSMQGPPSRGALLIHMNAAHCFNSLGRPLEAVRRLEAYFPAISAMFSGDAKTVLIALRHLIEGYEGMGDLRQASELLRQSGELARESLAVDDPMRLEIETRMQRS